MSMRLRKGRGAVPRHPPVGTRLWLSARCPLRRVSYTTITADLRLTYSTEIGIVLSEAKARFIELYRSSCSVVIRRKHWRYAPRWVKTLAGPTYMETL